MGNSNTPAMTRTGRAQRRNIMLIDWSDQWLVGEKRIDAEHQETVWLINRLHSAVEGQESPETVSKITASLVDLTEEHFGYEDRLMFAANYPKAADHRKQHQYLLKSIKSLAEDFADSKTHAGSVNALNSWFILHTSEDDASLGSFLSSRNQHSDIRKPEKKPHTDRLIDIKERLARSGIPQSPSPMWSDIEWLVGEVERLRSR